MKKHILIVEDDSHIRLGVSEALKSENYEVSEVSNGTQVLPLVKERRPDLIILDIMLPGKNGFDVCRDLRASGSRTPVLMLTAKGQEIDKVVGLELGADDYVTKPFGIRELLARVNALLRRAEQNGKPAVDDTPPQIGFGKVSVDTAAMRGTRGKTKFELSARELKLLALLFRKAGDVVSRNEILDAVWGIEYYGTTRTLDQVIVKLRQKIEEDPAEPVHLLTVHGVGYRLEV
ncbi:MAG: response regulator transcription factor [Verrucomicrobiota bacterium]